jgi:hypothetical protein
VSSNLAGCANLLNDLGEIVSGAENPQSAECPRNVLPGCSLGRVGGAIYEAINQCCNPDQLDQMARQLWQGYGAGSIGDSEATYLHGCIERRRPLSRRTAPGHARPLSPLAGRLLSRFTSRQRQRSPDRKVDAINRLAPLLAFHRDVVDAQLLIRVVARVLYHQSVDGILDGANRVVGARSILWALFEIGNGYPLAEKLARIYFVRWLRDGRVFRAEGAATRLTVLALDQNVSLIEPLLTLMTTREFSPATNSADEKAIQMFCEWVGSWRRTGPEIGKLVEELIDRFGLPDLWRRMLPMVTGDHASESARIQQSRRY